MVKSKGIPESPSQNAQRIQVSGIFCKICPSIFEDLKFWSFKKNKKTHPFFKAARTTDNETSFLQQCTCLKASTGSVSKCCVSPCLLSEGFSPHFFSILFISVFDGREVCFWHYFKTWQQQKHKKQLTLLLPGGEWPKKTPAKTSIRQELVIRRAAVSPMEAHKVMGLLTHRATGCRSNEPCCRCEKKNADRYLKWRHSPM